MLGVLNMKSTRYNAPVWVARVLTNSVVLVIARVTLTLPYWWSGIDKLLNTRGALTELTNAGFGAPIVVLIALVITQLGGSLLVIVNRFAWLGAGALGV